MTIATISALIWIQVPLRNFVTETKAHASDNTEGNAKILHITHIWIKSRWKVITKFNSIRFVCVWWKRILNDVCIKTLTLCTVQIDVFVNARSLQCIFFLLLFLLSLLLAIYNLLNTFRVNTSSVVCLSIPFTHSLRMLVNDEKFRQLLQLKHRKCSKSKINLNLV